MNAGEVLALSGGVGGAKLLLGLAQHLEASRLHVVVNTGDDFDHLGLRICPDIDTVLYTLAGLADAGRGWGRGDESWHFMEALAGLGGPDWFQLGDRDLALHVLRTKRLRRGESLDTVTAAVARAMGIDVAILPMSNEPVSTAVVTPTGAIPFQDYLVKYRCDPVVRAVAFDGIEAARPVPALDALCGRSLRAIVVGPSNPFVSIDPIRSIPGMVDLFRCTGAPIVAISPIVGGKAIKGPAAKMMAERGWAPSALAVARHYRGFVDGMIVDEVDASDAAAIEDLGMQVDVFPTVMTDLPSRIALAERALLFADRLALAHAHA